MKSIKRLFFILLVLTCVFCFGQTAFAAIGCESGDTGDIMVYPNAKGTMYTGTTTIYYTNINPNALDSNGFPYTSADMNFFLRLEKKSTLYAFSGQASVELLNVSSHQEKITSFIQNTVMPILYPDNVVYPKFLLKSVDKMVQDVGEENACCSGMLFTIMDVVIAVQNK